MLNFVNKKLIAMLFAISTFLFSACSQAGSANEIYAQQSSNQNIGYTVNTTSSSIQAATSTALSITGKPMTTAQRGNPYYFNANASGGRGIYAFSIKNKPSWATFNATTGELKGVPTTAGIYSNISIGVTDGSSSKALTSFTVTVVGSSNSNSSTSSGTIVLHWSTPEKNTDGTELTDLSGYIIHYGTNTTQLNKTITIGSRTAVSYTFSGLTKGTTYYFYVTAVNVAKMEGVSSSIVSITV